ncbi:MAG: NAD(P)H-binding protein, partial [Desulfohalobiaceae bacterium]
MSEEQKVLVTGATGYVGGRLIPRLLQAGYKVRAVARNKAKLASRSWAEEPGLELFQADALDPEAMHLACQGC